MNASMAKWLVLVVHGLIQASLNLALAKGWIDGQTALAIASGFGIAANAAPPPPMKPGAAATGIVMVLVWCTPLVFSGCTTFKAEVLTENGTDYTVATAAAKVKNVEAGGFVKVAKPAPTPAPVVVKTYQKEK